MKKRRVRRGVTAGTIVTLALVAVLAAMSCFVFVRLTGPNAAIEVDPHLFSDTLGQLLKGDAQSADGEPFATPAPTAAARRTDADEMLVIANTQATEAPTIYMKSALSLTAAGQVMLGDELRACGRQENGLYDFTDIFTPVSGALSGANLSIVTLRSTLGDGGYDDYCAPYTLATAFKSAGFNLVNLGTDRILDHGVVGAGTTRTVLQQRSLSSAGAYTSQQEANARGAVDINGVKVGIVSYTTSLSAASQKATSEEERAYGVRLYSEQTAQKDITALRDAGADVVIVLIHWGKRGDTEPSKTTQEQAAALARAGADVILGTGPTNVHRMEKRQVEDGRTAFIAYSLGNFLTDDSRETNDITGVVLHLEMEWDAQARSLSFDGSWYMPTWIMRWRENGSARYRILPAGSSTMPENMTDSIYVNMKKSYQAMVDKIGTDAAAPRAE